MKAILVIDKPECCIDCPCSYVYGYEVGTPTNDICEAMDGRKLTKVNMNIRTPEWCPLKPIPPKYGDITLTQRSQDLESVRCQYEQKLIAKGWNACIDRLLGGNDGED